MSDLISRQEAINVLDISAEFIKRALAEDIMRSEHGKYSWGLGLIEACIADLKELPSAQPETHEEHTETHECDLISRQAAIDALNEYFARIRKLKRRGLTEGEKAISLDTVGAIKTLPSAEPEIIRCKDCKYFDGDSCDRHVGDTLGYVYGTEPSDFCSFAERRAEHETD